MKALFLKSNHRSYPVGQKVRFCFDREVIIFRKYFFLKIEKSLQHVTLMYFSEHEKQIIIRFFDTQVGGLVNLIVALNCLSKVSQYVVKN